MDPFESPYWNLVQLIAWAITRNRQLVAMAGDIAGDPRWYRKTARLPDGSTIEFEEPAGPIGLRYLDTWLAAHPSTTQIPRRMVQENIIHALTKSQLHATGRRCGRGNRRQIDPLCWADLEFQEHPLGAASKLVGEEGVFWSDLLFPREEVLALWPPILAATSEEAHAPEVVASAPALQASEPLSAASGGEGEDTPAPPSQREKGRQETRARDQRLWDRRQELREKEPAINDSEITRRICKEEAAKEKAAKGKEIAGEEPKKHKPLTESSVRRILVRMKKRLES